MQALDHGHHIDALTGAPLRHGRASDEPLVPARPGMSPCCCCACSAQPERALDAAQPRTAAVRNIGNFSEALRCMDDLFVGPGQARHLHHDRRHPRRHRPDRRRHQGDVHQRGVAHVGEEQRLPLRRLRHHPARRAGAVRAGRAAQRFRGAELLHPRRHHPARQQRAGLLAERRRCRWPGSTSACPATRSSRSSRWTSTSAAGDTADPARASPPTTRSPWCNPGAAPMSAG